MMVVCRHDALLLGQRLRRGGQESRELPAAFRLVRGYVTVEPLRRIRPQLLQDLDQVSPPETPGNCPVPMPGATDVGAGVVGFE